MLVEALLTWLVLAHVSAILIFNETIHCLFLGTEWMEELDQLSESLQDTLTDDERTPICNWNTLYQNTHIKPWLITHRSELSRTFRTGTELFISESQTSKKLAAHYRAFVLGKLASGRESKWIKTTWRSSPFTPLFPFPLAIWIPSPGDRGQFSII